MKNFTITVNGNVYDVTVEEGGAGAAAPAAAPKAAPKAAEVKAEVKAEAKTEAKAAAPKAAKAAPAKPAAKRGPKAKTEAKVEVAIQFAGGQENVADIVENVKKVIGKDVKDLKIFVKPEDRKAYYVADGAEGEMDVNF